MTRAILTRRGWPGSRLMLTLAPPNDAQYTYSLGAIRTSAIPATIHVCFVAAAAAAEQPAAAAAAAAVAACCR